MEWTTESPTKPGWYWLEGEVLGLFRRVAPHAVLVEIEGGALHFWVPFMDYTEPVDSENVKGVRWYGPIEPPPLTG